MLEIKNLTVGYGKTEILHNISLNCRKGEITTIVGPNGCGKSTLLKSIIGMVAKIKGEIYIEGRLTTDMQENIRAQKVAYLSQGKNIPDITVGRMVLHGRFPYLSYPRKYRKVDYDMANEAMEMMGILNLADLSLTELSGGMRQKCYIAMALCQQAEVIMLDEPATYLDITQQLKLEKILRELADKGKTILVVSHDIVSALKGSDCIAVMNNGLIMADGTTEEILDSKVIPDVFGVEILSVQNDGLTEYFYRAKETKL